MRRIHPVHVPLLILAATAGAVGCAKKPPVLPPAAAPPAVAAPAPAPAEEVEPTETPLPRELAELNAELERRGLLGDIFFAFDEFALDAAARDRLARNAEFLNAHQEYLVTVEGHCDERGTNEYNLALGDRRSAAAREYLGSMGIFGGRLRGVSLGEERPQCHESAESCWSRNRRAHFVVTGRRE